tara:strand:+ start:1206 stop:1487 length:282 start_codon:yes stop_codon:yes gene_type:complete
VAKQSVEEIKHKLALVKKLKKDDSWKYLENVMKEEILSAAYSLSSDPSITLEELHWRRGALWASRKLIELPSALEVKLENELMMETLDEKGKK